MHAAERRAGTGRFGVDADVVTWIVRGTLQRSYNPRYAEPTAMGPRDAFDRLISEAIAQCVRDATTSRLEGDALRAYAEARIVSTFGLAWTQVSGCIVERTNRRREGFLVERVLA